MHTFDDAARALDVLEAAHRAATPEPWFLFWEEPNVPDEDLPDAVGTYDLHDGSPVSLIALDEDHVGDDEAGADLAVVEVSRNALPLLARVARAALARERTLDSPDVTVEEFDAARNELHAALCNLGILLPTKRDSRGSPLTGRRGTVL